jgi:hypothetical protein
MPDMRIELPGWRGFLRFVMNSLLDHFGVTRGHITGQPLPLFFVS